MLQIANITGKGTKSKQNIYERLNIQVYNFKQMETQSLKSLKIVKHYYWLDWMRFIAALMVLLSHSRGDFFGPYGNLPVEQKNILTMLFFSLTRLGYEAVLFFFVLSGYLVGGKVFSQIEEKSFNSKDYAIDRICKRTDLT